MLPCLCDVQYVHREVYIVCTATQSCFLFQAKLYTHRRLQARACPGIARVISKHCVLISHGPDAKTRGVSSDQHKRAYVRTDVHIAYSVVTIRFHKCASNAA